MIKKFLFFWIFFSVGMFFGEWLLDIVLKIERDTIKIEALESIIIGLVIALLIMINNIIKKNKK
ncbi:hypothetical protein [uncultured Draconibacterium sp.]|uniref:hypothetical protein n=1 Tax=uncultured Draconibacterium sp. TaxID=1573823 RepID=UPI002AA616B9|nr:hypothetical protein [uncultured Draconibacterium sp.]